MFTVTGRIGGTVYTAVVGDPAADTTPAHVGIVTGNTTVLALLAAHAGETVDVTATGPFLTLDLGQPDSILAALRSLTHVTEVTGDAPDLMADVEPGPAGAVY